MYSKSEQMISLIYGRRRIGKSELIKQSLRETDVQSIYYECKQTTERNNVDSLAEIIADIFDFPKPSFSNIEALLNFIFKKTLDFLSNLWYCWCYQRTGGNKMILQALKNMYPKASEKVLKAVMNDLEKCRGKNMSTEELADWIGKLVTYNR